MINERLKKIRKNYFKEDQKSFAEKINVSQSAVGMLEQGRQNPSAKSLIKLSEMGISIDWLFTGEGTMLRNDNESPVQKGMCPYCGELSIEQEEDSPNVTCNLCTRVWAIDVKLLGKEEKQSSTNFHDY